MSFFSFYFVIFFLAFIVLYWLIPKNTTWQKLVLLVASVIFIGFAQYYFALFVLGYALFIHLGHVWLIKKYIRELPLQIAAQYKHSLLQLYLLQNKYDLQCNLDEQELTLTWQKTCAELYGTQLRKHESDDNLELYEKLTEYKVKIEQTIRENLSSKTVQISEKLLHKHRANWEVIFNRVQPNSQGDSFEFLQAVNQVLKLNSELYYLLSTKELPLQCLHDCICFLELNNSLLISVFKQVGFDVQALHKQVYEYYTAKQGKQYQAQININLVTDPKAYNPAFVQEASEVPKLSELLAQENTQDTKFSSSLYDVTVSENSVATSLDFQSDTFASSLDFFHKSILKQDISIKDLETKFTFKSSNSIFLLCLVISLIPLIYFKAGEAIQEFYQNIVIALGFKGLDQFLPIIPILGISYFTFNAITYLVSSARGEIKPQNSLTTLVYICYFPTIVAGPIMRANFFVPQLNQVRKIENVNAIFYFLVRGILKKWWLSTVLFTAFVQPVFESPDSYNTFELILAAYAYGLQLYFDFSGYTDLMRAIGLSLGIKHFNNFDMPYISNNVKEFWRRWHISLSTWIRDYLYIAMGGNRHGFVKAQLFSLIAMLISGLWHGVALNFIVWSLLHGLALVFLNLKARYFNFSLGINVFARLITFNYVCFAWIFFASSDWDSAILFITSMITNIYSNWLLNNSLIGMLLIICYVVLQPLIYKVDRKLFGLITQKDNLLWIPVLLIIFACILTLAPSGIPPFIYEGF